MQYSTPHAYHKDIYTYLVHVDPGQIQTHLYVRGEFGQLQAQKKEGGRRALFLFIYVLSMRGCHPRSQALHPLELRPSSYRPYRDYQTFAVTTPPYAPLRTHLS